MPEPLRVALMGAGGRGRAVLKNWVEVTGCQVAAVVDPSQDSLDATKARLGDLLGDAELTTDVKGWLKHGHADLVTINSWDPQHAQNAIDCFEHGFNVQVAKPMTQTTADADRVVRAWKASGKLGTVDMQIRTSELTEKVMELIHAGAIGTVRLISCFDYVGRSGVEFRAQRSRRRDMIRSWTLAKGVHFLDLLNGLAGGEPRRVYASGGRDVFGGDKPNDLRCPVCDEKETCLYEGSKILIGGERFPGKNSGCVYAREMDVNDNCVAVIDYANGVRANYAECYFTPEYQTTYEVIGDRGAIFMRYAMDNRLYLTLRKIGSPATETIPIYAKGAHGGGDTAIIHKIRDALLAGSTDMTPNILDGRHAVALCEAIDRSVELGQPVDIPPAPC